MYLRVSAASLSVLAVAGAAFMGSAHAQQASKDGGRVGLVALGGYEYQGSDEARTQVLPALDYTWANGWFAGVSGVGRQWSSGEGLQYGVRLGVDMGREESRSSALRGLGNVDASAEVGGFARYVLGNGFAAKTSLRAGSGVDSKGALWDLGLEYGHALGASWRLGSELTATYANADYLQSYFGVTAKQAQASGYAVYTPSAGMRDVSARVSLTYLISPQWSLTGGLRHTQLLGDAKDAPMVRKTSANTALLALNYAF
ncbi:MipA/OmpV family protein [Rhodoferax bucti]|uniref:MipA/OmpV family protein n=1 Tax=Rhodoferax bucti TaxID=2576305 RepID=UPI00147784BD|nr:MipA/OmpV family protein [Rhodoferax bucti]